MISSSIYSRVVTMVQFASTISQPFQVGVKQPSKIHSSRFKSRRHGVALKENIYSDARKDSDLLQIAQLGKMKPLTSKRVPFIVLSSRQMTFVQAREIKNSTLLL